jgi:hypothetical protein
LKRAKRRKKQVSLLSRFSSARRRVRVAEITTFTTIPRRRRLAQQSVDCGTLFIGWGGVPQA